MVASIVSVGASAGSAAAGAAKPSASGGSVDAFAQSMERHGAGHLATGQQASAQAAPGQQAPDATNAVPAVSPNASVPDAQAQSRAREALGLNGADNGGDAILKGLQKLRGVFDQKEGMVSRLMSGSMVDTRAMMAMQMEVANFTLLVDLTSKLAGKSTQAADTLMKGQ